MTLTPLDLFALSGIPTGGQPIKVSPTVRISEEGIEATLRWHFRSVGVPHAFLIERLHVESHRIVIGRVQLTHREIR